MKASMIALTFVALTTTGIAHAADSVAANAGQSAVAQTQQWPPSQNRIAPKTRAEVRHELVQAQQDGQLAYLHNLYHGS
jgi:hypothetical protein